MSRSSRFLSFLLGESPTPTPAPAIDLPLFFAAPPVTAAALFLDFLFGEGSIKDNHDIRVILLAGPKANDFGPRGFSRHFDFVCVDDGFMKRIMLNAMFQESTYEFDLLLHLLSILLYHCVFTSVWFGMTPPPRPRAKHTHRF